MWPEPPHTFYRRVAFYTLHIAPPSNPAGSSTSPPAPTLPP
jgi:hypothetical protein